VKYEIVKVLPSGLLKRFLLHESGIGAANAVVLFSMTSLIVVTLIRTQLTLNRASFADILGRFCRGGNSREEFNNEMGI